MIPKKIHYCWFGNGEKPTMAKKCIASWRKYCPDYEIIEWNEKNFDVNLNEYTKMCYEQKKYAFLTDYIRLYVVEREGGIYFDTDVEVIRPLDKLTEYSAFFGFENSNYVNTGLGFGAEQHHPIVSKMLKEYDQLLDGCKDVIVCTLLNTRALESLGLKKNAKKQKLAGNVIILPPDYLNPRDSITGELNKTPNTYSIHWYAASWLPWWKRLKSTIGKPIHRFQKKIGKYLR